MVVAITAAWFLALLVATGLVFGILGDVVTFWVHTSGYLLGAHDPDGGAGAPLRSVAAARDPDHSAGHRERGEWTTAELSYALVFTFTLFIFLNSVAYLYFSG